MEDQSLETTVYSIATAPPERRSERRGDERYLSLLRVGAITIGTQRELCLIRNLSAGGMMIRAYCPLRPGSRIAIELKQGDPVSGSVQWLEKGLAGVTFDAPVDVLALLTSPTEGPAPRLPRIGIDCTAWVRDGADVIRCRANNISQGGVCMDSAVSPVEGTDVVVTFLGLRPVPGIVKWIGDGTFGIAFNRTLALSELVAWLQSQQREQAQRAVG